MASVVGQSSPNLYCDSKSPYFKIENKIGDKCFCLQHDNAKRLSSILKFGHSAKLASEYNGQS